MTFSHILTMTDTKSLLARLCSGLPESILDNPKILPRREEVNHAPKRSHTLSTKEVKQVYRNALRYIPKANHAKILPLIKQEFETHGHVYFDFFRPDYIKIQAYPIDYYPAKSKTAASIMLMIMNNLADEIAQYPDELVTYGGNGQVFQNWAQFLIIMNYLSKMTEEQCLVLYSGHPLGLFPAEKRSPRMIITNGMVIPNYSSRSQYENMFALGVSQYGQMTAGSFCYIGPQGIVHGTTITVMNACRKYLKTDDPAGVVFVTSGLGGMSGAQAKAAKIAGCVGVIAETDELALIKRHEQGWLDEFHTDVDTVMEKAIRAKKEKLATSIGYLGSVVDIWEWLVEHHKKTGECLVELGSDQSSCHNVEGGGYSPVGMTAKGVKDLLAKDPVEFLRLVRTSLKRHFDALVYLTDNAKLNFWDYGNAFLLECRRSGAAATKPGTDPLGKEFIYPSYFQHIMGDIFSMGFGPFRWVCTSCDARDLEKTDEIAMDVMTELAAKAPERERQQYEDNIKWIKQAGKNKLVVGSQARILYTNQAGRREIALAFKKFFFENYLIHVSCIFSL